MSILLLITAFIHVLEDRKRDGSGMISGKRTRGEETVTVQKLLFLRVLVSNSVVVHLVHFISHGSLLLLSLIDFYFLLSLLSLCLNHICLAGFLSLEYTHDISVLFLTSLATTASAIVNVYLDSVLIMSEMQYISLYLSLAEAPLCS